MELLYDGNSEPCKQKFKAYLEEKVVKRTEDTDNALKKFFKGILQKLSQDHNEVYVSAGLASLSD